MKDPASTSETVHLVQRGLLVRRLVRGLLTAAFVLILLCAGGGWWWFSRPDFGDAVRAAGGRYRSEVLDTPAAIVSNAISGRATTVFHWIEFAPGDVNDVWLHQHRDQISRLSYLVLMLRDTEITGDGLSALSGMQNLQYLELTGTKLDDADVAHITSLTNTATVYVGRTGLSASAVANLSQMQSLAAVGIDSTQATPEGIAGLAACPRLGSLMLLDADDDSVNQIAQLTGLIGLGLIGENVTTASFPALKQMQGLQVLTFFDSSLTEDDIFELQQALPGCIVQKLDSEVLEQAQESAWE